MSTTRSPAGVGLLAQLEVLGELLDLHIVAQQVLDHLVDGSAVLLDAGAGGNHVVLGEEVVVLLVAGTEDIRLGSGHVGLVDVVGTDGIRVDVLDAADIALQLVAEHAVLVLGDELGVAHQSHT